MGSVWLLVRWKSSGVLDAYRVEHVRVSSYRLRAKASTGETVLVSWDKADMVALVEPQGAALNLNREIMEYAEVHNED